MASLLLTAINPMSTTPKSLRFTKLTTRSTIQQPLRRLLSTTSSTSGEETGIEVPLTELRRADGGHPFVKSGSKGLNSFMIDEDGMYMRLDLPGVRKEGMKMWVEKKTVFVEATEESAVGSDEVEEKWLKKEVPRSYFVEVRLCFHDWAYSIKDIKAVMKNGVLKILIPNIK